MVVFQCNLNSNTVREGVLEIESNDLETLLQRPVAPINEALNRLVGSLKK